MARSIPFLSCAIALAITCTTLSPAHAQLKKGAEFITGTVVSIEKEKTGKNHKLKMTRTDNGEELEVAITLKTLLFVNAKGDEGFLKPGAIVETKATISQQNLFADEFTVYLGAITPPARMVPDKDSPKDVLDLLGKITETQQDGFTLHCGQQQQKIMFDKEKLVNVKISDTSLIKEGDEVEVEGLLPKNKKVLNASSVQVKQKDPIKSLDYLAALEEKNDKRKPKSAASAKSKSASKTKTESDEPSVPKGGDPFGVTSPKKKTTTKDDPKKDAATKDDAKKDDAKKDDAKKDEAKKDEAKKE